MWLTKLFQGSNRRNLIGLTSPKKRLSELRRGVGLRFYYRYERRRPLIIHGKGMAGMYGIDFDLIIREVTMTLALGLAGLTVGIGAVVLSYQKPRVPLLEALSGAAALLLSAAVTAYMLRVGLRLWVYAIPGLTAVLGVWSLGRVLWTPRD